MSGNPFEDDSDAVARIVRAAEVASRRSDPQRSKEARDLIALVGLRAGIPPRRPRPQPRKPQPAVRKPAEPRPPQQSAERSWSLESSTPLNFGDYEIAREISHAGAAAVYGAKQSSDPDAPPKFVIKAITPPGIWSPEESKQHIHDFIAAAALQKRMADAHPRGNWAPIHGDPVDSGSAGAYYISDRFVRSADDLASPQREAISEEDLWRLVSGVVDGLEQLEKTADRPHGNLKAGNVLLARWKGGYKASLADPHPDDAAAREAGRAGDLHNLGDLIRRLVLRDSGGTDAATASLLGAPTAWAPLGAAAQKWREMCGALLEGGAKYPAFDDIRRALKPLRPANRARGVQLAVVAAIIVIILGIIGIRAYLLSFKKENWTQLCREWDWYEKSRTTFKQYAEKQDDDLKKMLAAPVLSPAEIAHQQLDSRELAALADQAPPPKDITKPAGVSETRRSLAAISALHNKLRNPTWHFWTDIDRHLGNLKDLEPNLAAPLSASLQVLRAFIADNAGEIPPNSGVDLLVTLNASDLLDRLETLNNQLAAVRAAATPDKNPDHCDPFIAEVLNTIHSKVNIKPDVDRLNPVATYLDITGEITAGLSDPVNHFEWRRIKEDIDQKTVVPENPSAVGLQQAVEEWLRKVKPDYYAIPAASDPRQKNWAARVGLDTLAKLADDTEAQPAMDDELRAQLAARRKGIDELRVRNDALLHSKIYVHKELADLTKSATAIADQSSQLQREIRTIYDAAAVPTDFLATIPGQTAPPNVSSKSVINFWYARKQALLIANPTVPQTRQMFKDVKALTKAAQELDGLLSIPQMLEGQAAFEWGKAFQTFQLDDREATISALCDKAPLTLANGELPPPFKREEAAAKDTWAKWQAARSAWVGKGLQIEKLLTPGGGYYSLGDTPPDDKSPLQDRWLSWLSEPTSREFSTAMKHPVFAPAITLVKTARYEPLARVRNDPTPPIEDVNALLAGVAPEQKFAGWQAAGKLSPPDWPLTQEQTARKSVAAIIDTVPDADRKALLDKIIRDETQRRWMGYAKPSVVPATQPATPGEVRWPPGLEMVASAASLEADFKIDAGKLDQKTRYNLRLAALIEEARKQFTGNAVGDPNTANAKAVEMWQAFVDQSKPVIADPSVTMVASELDLAKADADKSRKVGGDEKVPFKANGWTLLKPPPTETEDTYMAFEFRAANAAPIRFEFIRVVPSGDLPDAFLSRTTVSVAQFNAFVQPDIADRLPTDPTAVYEKDPAGGKIRPQAQWAVRSPSMLDNQDALKLGGSDLPRPTAALPMQMIRAIDAKLWIKALDPNLRLPRPEEWLTAVKATPAAKRANLRDASWKAQDAYFAALPPDAAYLNPRAMNRLLASGDTYATDRGNIWNIDLTAIAGAPYDDGALMFLPADPSDSDKTRGQFGTQFYHLVGNVWQLVLSQGKDQKDQYAVVGGSALSPPEMGWAKPVPLAKQRQPYSDVGFRLAFDAPIQPPRRRLLATLQKAKFLFD